MHADWMEALVRTLARGEDAVLVTVARAQASTPREAGATLVVSATSSADTIGGGHLEWQAIRQARALLAAPSHAPQVTRFVLGARLGQCCGGVVWLLFEPIAADTLAQWQSRLAALSDGQALHRELDCRRASSIWTTGSPTGDAPLLAGTEDDWHFRQDIVDRPFPVRLFGAGHVARALVRLLPPLGARITWIDTRDDAFAGLDTAGLTPIVTDTPEAEVAAAPPGAFFLVMTHTHALDFALCEAVFRRHDFAYFGLIGSRSKRAAFEHRLVAHGLPPERLPELTCPIGIPGIPGKEPNAIALSVAAQLLQVHCARNLVAQARRPGRIGAHRLPE